MSVEFNKTTNQRIRFTSPAWPYAFDQYSISAWVNQDTILNTPRYQYLTGIAGTSTSDSQEIAIVLNDTGNGYVRFGQEFTGTSGIWESSTNVISAGVDTNIIFTYDNTSNSNDPILYISGVATALTEISTPSGIPKTGPTTSAYIGAHEDATELSPDGTVYDVRYYNRILTPTEAKEIADSKCQRSILDGLVFWASLNGAKGLSSFDGITLGTENTIRSNIIGQNFIIETVGVPSGSPVGKGNTVQRIY